MAAVEIGVFVIPDAAGRDAVIEQVALADRLGLDLVGIQDHPYQRRFLDTWMLMATVLAKTERVTVFPDVANLPLRQPAEHGLESRGAGRSCVRGHEANLPHILGGSSTLSVARGPISRSGDASALTWICRAVAHPIQKRLDKHRFGTFFLI